jgi:hypothetical protein
MQGVLNQLLHDVRRISEHLSVTPTEGGPSRPVDVDHVSQPWRSRENQGQVLNSQRQSETRTERRGKNKESLIHRIKIQCKD